MWTRTLLRKAAAVGWAQLRERSQILDCKAYCRPLVFRRWCHSQKMSLQQVFLVKDPMSSPFELTKEQIDYITKGDPVKENLLNELMLKLYVRKEQGDLLPDWARLSDIEAMLTLGHTQLTRMLKYLCTNCRADAKEMEEKKKRQENLMQAREERERIYQSAEHPWLSYNLSMNALFPRLFKGSTRRYYDAYISAHDPFAQKIVFDCAYESEMDEMRLKHTAKQIFFSLSFNRDSRRPFSMHLCNLNPDGRLMFYLRRLHPDVENDTPVHLHSSSYLDIFDRKSLVYLSPHTTQTIVYNPNDVYILGALVDVNVGLNLSNRKAIKEKIRSAALPLGHLKWKKGSKSLCTHHVFNTMLMVKNGSNWKDALAANVPERKVFAERGLQDSQSSYF